MMTMKKLTFPIALSPDITKETLLLEYEELRLAISFNNWLYCTELDGCVDLSSLASQTLPSISPMSTTALIVVHPEVLIETGNPSTSDMIRHYNERLSSLVPHFKRRKDAVDDSANNMTGDWLGMRRCADIITGAQLNCYIDLDKLVEEFPYAQHKEGTVVIALRDILEEEEIVDGMPLFRKTEAYTQFKLYIERHRESNQTLRLVHNDEIVEESLSPMNEASFDRAKAIITHSGQILMDGVINRTQVVQAYYILLQVIGCCLC